MAAPVKPVIDLPPASVKAEAAAPAGIAPLKTITPTPVAKIPAIAPGPKYIVSAPKTETSKDAPQPAIVPEAAKAPLPPTAESAALRRSDKVVSLPPLSSAGEAPKIAELKPLAPPVNNSTLPPPPKLIEAKPSAKSSETVNIANPDFMNAPEQASANQSPVAVKVKKIDEEKVENVKPVESKPAEPKLIASATDKSIIIPEKAQNAVASEAVAAPKPFVTSKPLVQNLSPAPETKLKTLPPEAVQTSLASAPSANSAKPSSQDLPPLSSLFDKQSTSAQLAIAPAPVTTDMPSRESIIVQPQELAQNDAQIVPVANSALSIVYSEAQTEIPLADKAKLDAIATQLNSNKNARITVISYASGTPDQSSQAKRTALARAFEIRKYFLEHGIAKDRLDDIKPLGNKSTSGVPDRVDLIVEKTGRS